MSFEESKKFHTQYDLCDLANAERDLVEQARQAYPKHYAHLQFAIEVLHNCFKEAEAPAHFFIAFKASVEKHAALAALSSMRLHHVQTILNLRQVSEATAWAIFALAHPTDTEKYVEKSVDGLPFPSQDKKKKMYDWVAAKYPKGSASLKRFKDYTNSLSSHANIIDAFRNFDASTDGVMSLLFFDSFQEHHLLTDMWSVANLTIGSLGLMKRASEDYQIVTWADDFPAKYKELSRHNNEILIELRAVFAQRLKERGGG